MDVYKKRREKLMAQMDEKSVAILYSASSSSHSRTRPRQDSDFYYLTGLEERDSILVLDPEGENPFVLIVPPRDPKKEAWMGPMVGPEGAKKEYGAHEAFSSEEAKKHLKEFLRNKDKLYYSFGHDEGRDREIHQILRELRGEVRQGVTAPRVFYNLKDAIHEMRLIKDETEIGLLRKATSITARAHRAAMQFVRPGIKEYEVQAVLEYEFRKEGAFLNSFAPIVAGGENALILHYEENEDTLKDGDLVLIDAGCEYDYYAGDITRTIPINGTFTEPQRQVYEVVLKAQREAISMTRPGVPYLDLHKRGLRVLTEGLVDLGILEGEVEELIEEKEYFDFYMHKLGHWMGMDVHDVGAYNVDGEPRPLRAGMVFTVEPGLYIPNREDVPEAYRGIGIRIEEDVLVTPDGVEVLTAELPNSPDEVEAIMAESWRPFER